MATQQEVFDTLVNEIRRIGAKVDSICGPDVVNNPKAITIKRPPPASDTISPYIRSVVPVILRSTNTGSGFYNGDYQYNSPVLANGTSDLSLPFTNQQAGTNSQVLIYNPSETGIAGHSLSPSNGAEVYGAALQIGVTKETPQRDVVMFLGGGGGGVIPNPRTIYQILTVVSTNGTVAFTYPLFN